MKSGIHSERVAAPSPVLKDPHGRQFEYLRLSLTDVCNFHCQYCLPNGYQKTVGSAFLSADEVENLVRAMNALGVWKVRLTGGEPTLRKDFVEIAARVSAIPGIRKLAVTTNGHDLAKKAALWREAGLTHLNVSVDSLDPHNFRQITGHDRLPAVLEGIYAAQKAGFGQIKVNTVLLKGLNDHELPGFLDWVKSSDISLRFIELMQTGDNLDYFRQHHLSGQVIADQLLAQGWEIQPRQAGAGPAKEFAHPDYQGRIGIISPYSKDFCTSCNRLRVSARGDLRLCLFGQGGHSIRHLLQSPEQKTTLENTLQSLLAGKVPAHQLHFGITGSTRNLATIGG